MASSHRRLLEWRIKFRLALSARNIAKSEGTAEMSMRGRPTRLYLKAFHQGFAHIRILSLMRLNVGDASYRSGHHAPIWAGSDKIGLRRGMTTPSARASRSSASRCHRRAPAIQIARISLSARWRIAWRAGPSSAGRATMRQASCRRRLRPSRPGSASARERRPKPSLVERSYVLWPAKI